MKEDTKEVFGIGKDDFWYYPGLAAGIASFWFSGPIAVATLLLVSTAFLLVFLVKSTPRYLASPELRAGTRAFGLAGNIGLIVFQVALIGVRLWRLATSNAKGLSGVMRRMELTSGSPTMR